VQNTGKDRAGARGVNGVLKMGKTYFAAGRTWMAINGNAGKTGFLEGEGV
jgi:hypothetical protein